MENFEKCTVAMLGGPCSQHVTGNTSRLNHPQSATMRDNILYWHRHIYVFMIHLSRFLQWRVLNVIPCIIDLLLPIKYDIGWFKIGVSLVL